MSEPTVPTVSEPTSPAEPPASVASATPPAAVPPTGPPSSPPNLTGPETFRVRCPDCGPQVVAVSAVRYVETGEGPAANRYVFACPECGARVRRPAGPELSEILCSSGVATLALHRGPGEAV